jgi:urea carboxylase/allophanate hydrolase
LTGLSLKFHYDFLVAVVGGECQVRKNDETVPMNRALKIKSGQILNVGTLESGYRVYIAIARGINVPTVMGSRAMFELAKLGGYKGRKLEKGDILPLIPLKSSPPSTSEMYHSQQLFPFLPKGAWNKELIPSQPNAVWNIGVIPGPHGAPDFFIEEGIASLFNSSWIVHYNSNRMGIRLTGPQPQWARAKGGEAGLHPSNIHDTPYSVGSVSFTGDEAIVLSRDGPSLGGFVVFCVVTTAEMWKLGQLRPGDEIRFVPMTAENGHELHENIVDAIQRLAPITEFVQQELQPDYLTPLSASGITTDEKSTYEELVTRLYFSSLEVARASICARVSTYTPTSSAMKPAESLSLKS